MGTDFTVAKDKRMCVVTHAVIWSRAQRGHHADVELGFLRRLWPGRGRARAGMRRGRGQFVGGGGTNASGKVAIIEIGTKSRCEE